MHTVRVFEIWLQRNCSFVHCARMAAIVKLVDGLLLSGKATLAELAHWLPGNGKTPVDYRGLVRCGVGP